MAAGGPANHYRFRIIEDHSDGFYYLQKRTFWGNWKTINWDNKMESLEKIAESIKARECRYKVIKEFD